jgi:hypothetical protein
MKQQNGGRENTQTFSLTAITDRSRNMNIKFRMKIVYTV